MSKKLLLLEQAIGSERFRVVADSPVTFVKVFDKRDPFEHQADAMRAVVERKLDGKFKKRVQVISWPRQNGKSITSAWLGVFLLYTAPSVKLIVTVALDRESARIVFDAAKEMIEADEVLRSLVDESWGVTKNEIKLSDGRRWIIRSADGRLSRGLSPDIVLFDELGWSIDDGALYQVLQAGQAARPNPLTVITSTVSPIKDGALWNLFQAAERNDPAVGLLYSRNNDSPMVTTEFLAEQEVLLPPTFFAREHRNEWVEGGDAFSTEDDWLRAVTNGVPTRLKSDGPCYAFLDLGLTHDESVLAICEQNAELGTWDVIHMETWRGTQAKPVHLPSVRERIQELIEIFGVKFLEIESWQGIGLGQELADIPGTTVTSLHATNKSNAERYGAFYAALKEGKIRLPNDKLLRRQLLTMVFAQIGSGAQWKMEDRTGIHNDRAVACAGALFLGLQSTLAPKWKNIKFLAMTPDGPVSGPNLEPLGRTREPYIDHRPNIPRREIPVPISGTEIRLASEAAEADGWSESRKARIANMYLTYMQATPSGDPMVPGHDTTRKSGEAISQLCRQFGADRRQIMRVLEQKELL